MNIRIGNYDWAIEDIADVVKLYQHLDFAHFYLGVAYEKKGDQDNAIQEFRKTIELNPGHEEAREKLGIKNVL